MFDDVQRVKALRDYRVLDTPPEAAFDNITQMAASVFSAPIVLVSLVDEERQWFKSRVGLDATETPRSIAFCDHAIRGLEPLVVEDATIDPRFASNPLVTGVLGVRFYCGVPLRTPDGHGLGTLCLIDRVPREMNGRQLDALKGLAHQVEIELEIRRRLIMLEESLSAQQRQQRAKELMAAMLVHDLRAPLSAITLLADSLAIKHPDSHDQLRGVLDEAERMRRMLIDVLDICLSDGETLRLRCALVSLPALALDVGHRFEQLARQAGQSIGFELAVDVAPFEADPELLERTLTNLIGNAIRHGPAQPITVAVHNCLPDRVRVEVRDLGTTIPEIAREKVFLEFVQLEKPDVAARGYGLGLAFCRLAIEAHGGTIGVTPHTPCGNTFHFELPRVRAPRRPSAS